VVLEAAHPFAFPIPEVRPMMDQIATRFTPPALIVRTSQQADFRNDDDKLHNVRVRERGQPAADLVFNIALPQGGAYPHVFDRDGVWDVRCDVHQNMYGLVVSTSSPYATVSTAEGTYEIAGVLPGAYTAIAYTSRDRVERAVMLAPGQRARVDLR
jgi:plastocyanin